jgi:hypothetical protein
MCKPARPVSLVPAATDAPPVDSASAIVDVVSADVEEASGDQDEEMLDYDPTLDRAEVNVVYLSSNYYVVGDDSRTTRFDFATQSAVF